jgi:hypothetical protein
VGQTILHAGDQDEHLDLDFLLQHLSIKHLPKFNGGIYCFERSPASAAFFDTARALLNRAKELRFKDFRGDGPNDESIYATAMALHGLTLTDMSPGGMWTPIAASTPIEIDVLRGVCRFNKRGVPVQPDIIHFATWTESFLYLRECRKLEKVAATSYSIEPKTWPSFSQLLSLRFRVAALRLRKAYFGAIRRSRQLAAHL